MAKKLWKNAFIGAAYLVGISTATCRWMVTGMPLLVISILTYIAAPHLLGVAPFTPIQMIEFFAENHEVWLGILGLAVAIVAAQSFMDSKRLDMRLAAAADIQDLSERATRMLIHCNLLAESLDELRNLVESNQWKSAGLDQKVEQLQQSLIAVKVTYVRGKQAQDEAWSLLLEVTSIEQKHRLALMSSAIAYIGIQKAQKYLDEAADASAFIVPSQIDDLDFIVDWVQRTEAESCRKFITSYVGLREGVSTWLGSVAGALGHGIFPQSAVALGAQLRAFAQLYTPEKQSK